MIAKLLIWIIGDVTPIFAAIGRLYDWMALRLMKPVMLDGALYTSIAAFVFMQGYLSSDEAYKYCNPYILFWAKFFVGSIAAGAGALKMYRSNTYADHQRDEAAKLQQTNK